MSADKHPISAFIGVHRRLLPCLWLFAATPALAVSRIEIHIGQISHPSAQVENLTATVNADGHWQGIANLKQADLAALSKNYALPVNVSKGTASGRAEFAGEGRELKRLKADLDLRDATFSDADGLHAGEKIGGRVKLDASRGNERWQGQAGIQWREGEVFWQPLYLTAGHALQVQGWWTTESLQVDVGSAELSGIGKVAFSGRLNMADKSVASLELSGRDLHADKGYEALAKPFLGKTMLGNLETAGSLDIQASLSGGQLNAFRLMLHDVDVEDKNGRFALYKVNASVPWVLNSITTANVRFNGGRILKLALGEADLAANLEGWSLTATEWKVPVLDGAVILRNISAAVRDSKWYGHFASQLAPISMGEFSHALGWPRMEGRLGATVPLVTYSDGELAMDGAMQFDIFDGQVAVSNLALHQPLGLAPRFNADIRMRNLDLDLLTRTFSFGAMSGHLDGDVSGLELSSWKPVKFDASFRSSPGRYPKKISQRAVENISALGGAGAAAAIQRSFLRFFKEFNYDRIGLSCRLRNGICAMDGIEPVQGGYVIVKGSGIPAITVLGYNRNVSWEELLERVQRITQGNTKPVVK
ncbi:MAG TPA: hypothetical protein VGK14_02400 [Novimethylophilus sp.]|jgi:hypothetical protein|uniref:hypothetical protein n=1 Tax=Novimethylophilus sp. TaxID=2137426 RepID=UPI002F41E96D